MLIKPIPTPYNGDLFRSKLEARWAYYFTMNKIKYDYEPDTYGLSKWYEPDFYLNELNYWIEIKPYKHRAFQNLDFTNDFIKFVELVNTSNIDGIFLAGNMPFIKQDWDIQFLDHIQWFHIQPGYDHSKYFDTSKISFIYPEQQFDFLYNRTALTIARNAEFRNHEPVQRIKLVGK